MNPSLNSYHLEISYVAVSISGFLNWWDINSVLIILISWLPPFLSSPPRVFIRCHHIRWIHFTHNSQFTSRWFFDKFHQWGFRILTVFMIVINWLEVLLFFFKFNYFNLLNNNILNCCRNYVSKLFKIKSRKACSNRGWGIMRVIDYLSGGHIFLRYNAFWQIAWCCRDRTISRTSLGCIHFVSIIFVYSSHFLAIVRT